MTDVCGNGGNDLLQYCRVDIENSHVKSASQACPRLKQLALSIRPVNESKKKVAYRSTTFRCGRTMHERGAQTRGYVFPNLRIN